MKKIVCIFLSLCMMLILSSCAMFDSEVNSLNGSITGNTYECQFYSNNGNKFMTLTGQKIDINSNIIRERTYDSDGWGYVKTLSSVITITVDGHQMSNCGSTVLFVEKGLTPDVVAIIQSQLGDPICAFSGNDVYWEVCEDLPKTTKLMIDGHALYIHRANFQLIDIDLLN